MRFPAIVEKCVVINLSQRYGQKRMVRNGIDKKAAEMLEDVACCETETHANNSSEIAVFVVDGALLQQL